MLRWQGYLMKLNKGFAGLYSVNFSKPKFERHKTYMKSRPTHPFPKPLPTSEDWTLQRRKEIESVSPHEHSKNDHEGETDGKNVLDRVKTKWI